MEKFVCPRCGKRSMIKKETEDGKYFLICQSCGMKRGKLPKDKRKDVI